MYSKYNRANSKKRYVAARSSGQYFAVKSRPLPMLTMASPVKNWECKVLPYVQVVDLSSDVAGVTGAIAQFRMNSIFAPAVVSGHQPYGYDQYSVFWNKYKVYRVDVMVEFLLPTASTATFGVVAMQPPGDTYNYAGKSLNTVSEKPGAVAIRIPNADGGSTEPAKFQGSYDIATLSGLTKTMFDGDQTGYASLINGNPTGVPVMTLTCANATGTNTTSCTARVHLNYHVQFYDRITQAFS